MSLHPITKSTKWSAVQLICWKRTWSAIWSLNLHSPSVCCIHCLLRLYPWLWYFSLSEILPWSTLPFGPWWPPHRSGAEFTFFTNPLSSATKTLSSPDQNRPVDTSSRVPEHSLTSSARLIGSLRGKRCCMEETGAGGKSRLAKSSGCCRESSTMTTTASLGRDNQQQDGGSKVRNDVWRGKHLQCEALETRTSYNNSKDQEQAPKN